ncbi:WD40/YVTN/BNR-like repeat-containing protein [Clostridium aciditolerans]|uniref:Exo-alpha-sialidase n=1 Tax=Clostridium aciditolerans TaxID=339861 RepID=A0A934HV12_9CLOT|nr:sialidase family protein [Clostridium aciditolerans]MBI6874820.1 exo-alpha-sialidase [Clostridium aciditolerans]
MKKKRWTAGLSICTIVILSVTAFLYFKEQNIEDGVNKGKVISIVNKDGDLLNIGGKLIQDYMKPFINKSDEDRENIRKLNVKKEEILEFNKDEMVVKVDFDLIPQNNKTHKSWGKIKNGKLEASWILKIKILDNYTYKIIDKEKSKGSNNKSKIVMEAEKNKKSLGKINRSYYLDGHNIKVTYDKGESWINVPIDAKVLFDRGEPLKNTDELQNGSFIITPKNTSFVYGGSDRLPITVLISEDKGITWRKSLVTNKTEGSRQLFIDFTSDKDGHVVASGDRAMSSEMTYVYETTDGGRSWSKIGDTSKITHTLVNGAVFSTDKIGFICYKSYDKYPNIRYTIDKGSNWTQLKLPLPTEYEDKFTEAQSPRFEGEKGVILVGQGNNGELGKGKMSKFTTEDYGLTWKFDGIVTVE